MVSEMTSLKATVEPRIIRANKHAIRVVRAIDINGIEVR